MFEGCGRTIKNGSDWVRCGDSGKRCVECGGDYRLMSDDEIVASIIRHDLSMGVTRGDRTATIVISVLLIVALFAWGVFK